MKRRRPTVKFDRAPRGQAAQCVMRMIRRGEPSQCFNETRNRPAWCYAHADALDVLERLQGKLPL